MRLTNSTTLILEIKGWADEQDKAKYQTARWWRDAVNHWGRLGYWEFHVCKDPQMLGKELFYFAAE